MNYNDVYVGMRVRIRSWEDMDEDAQNVPNHPYNRRRLFAGVPYQDNYVFDERMKPLCGKEFTVTALTSGHMIYLDPEPITAGHDNVPWNIEAWMVEPAEDAGEIEADEDGLFAMLA